MKNEKKVALLTVWLLLLTCMYLVSWTDTYDIATPAGSDDPAEADDRMQEIKAATQERLNVEHVFDLTGTEVSDANTGKHTDITTNSIVNAGSYSGTTITISSTLDVSGNIDPTTYETTNGGFLDEDDLASDANDKVASQQSIKKYVDDNTGGQSSTKTGTDDITNDSGSFADMTWDGDDNITITTKGGNVLLLFSATMELTSATLHLQFDMDGTPYGFSSHETNSEGDIVSMHYLLTSVSAAEHVFKVQWKDAAGLVAQDGASFARTFTVIEFP